MRHGTLGVALAFAAWMADAAVPAPDFAPLQTGLDYHSFANIEQFRVTRLEIDLRVDSEAKVLRCVVGLMVKRLDPSATQLVLDTRDLAIAEVAQKAQDVLGALTKTETTWVNRPYHVERKDPVLGQALVIDLPPSKKSSEFIRIEYETSPTAPGLNWVPAKLTAGGGQPFFFTESEPLGARSWLPLQDTPQVRMTYTAAIHTSPDVLAVMSAHNDRKVKRNGEYIFVMPDAVPSYLMALAVGDLKFQETGPRSGVYAEKPLLKQAVQQFAGAEAMLTAGEKLFGAYPWERHDVVVLPPGFSASLAAHPRLSFLSPTEVTGDKSMAVAVARSVAHGWSGELVSNAAWRDHWVTEAVAEYGAERILDAVYGPERVALQRTVDLHLPADLAALSSDDQVLATELRDRNPEVAFSGALRDKAGVFMDVLDARFGRERLDPLLRAYVDRFEGKTVTTEQFVRDIEERLLAQSPGAMSRETLTAWVNGPGLPGDAVLPHSELLPPVDAARAAWLAGSVPAKKLATQTWLPPQWMYFLEGMPANLTAAQLADLDRTFLFARSTNADLVASWLALVIAGQYQPGFVRLEAFLTGTGRRSLLVPLYAKMMASRAGATQARRVFALARPVYSAATASAVAAIVTPEPDDDE